MLLGDNLNLLKEGGARLTTCTNYDMDVLPDRTNDWSHICDLVFTLILSASRDPAHITVRFDDVYVVNQVTFHGYMPESDVASAGDADRANSPFCYKVCVCGCVCVCCAWLCVRVLCCVCVCVCVEQ